ncbi:MAG: DUF1848 family protein [Kiritimatiellae bacterium]|nr:DUF1848 family protein [Kiritimatiellia bacterium]
MVPIILSASRETDIPAFYSDWFVSRLRERWCEWKNTYSGKVREVSFDTARMIVGRQTATTFRSMATF